MNNSTFNVYRVSSGESKQTKTIKTLGLWPRFFIMFSRAWIPLLKHSNSLFIYYVKYFPPAICHGVMSLKEVTNGLPQAFSKEKKRASDEEERRRIYLLIKH